MRDILFRGKRIDNGEWIEGFYCQRKEKIFGGVKTRHMILVPDADSYTGARWIDVNPTTIGRYTGLIDKNGKKIFDGDIVKVSSPSGSSYYAKIEYDCGCYWVSNPDIQIPDTINNFNMDFVVVDGTIFDNPELLEVKE